MAIPVLNMDTSNLIELLPKLWTKAISYSSPWGANLKKNEGVMVVDSISNESIPI